MGCSHCGCDCLVPPHIPPAPQPIRELSDDEIKRTIEDVWIGISPDIPSMPLHFLTGMVLQRVETKRHEYRAHEARIRAYAIANYTIVKGRNGGIIRPTNVRKEEEQQWQSYGALMSDSTNRITDTDIQECMQQLKTMNESTAVAINNHVCPHCKNDKVSRNERSCWKCGGSLH